MSTGTGRRTTHPLPPPPDWFSTATALRNTAENEGASHEVTEHYKHDDVRMALEELFYDKCAYCESSLTATASWDIEHYRPKGRVAERADHPGYYWLAYEWTNLLPACEFCNQRRKDAPRYGDPQPLPAQGKFDQFPLAGETQRAMSPDSDLDQEAPLLLNPCEDQPEQHLVYDIHGQVHPRCDDDLRATETIRICHLQRRRLRDARARTIAYTAKLAGNLRLAGTSGNAQAVTLLRDVMDDCVAPGAVYAGAARAVQQDPDAFALSAVGDEEH